MDRSKTLFSGDTNTYCEENWEKNGGSCFYWSKKYLKWTEAEEFCSEKGGHLVSVISNATNEYILRKIESMPRDIKAMLQIQRQIWIGGNDKEEEGEWVWTDSSPWKFTNWGPNQPNNYSGQDCLIYFVNFGWNDFYCNKKQRFICRTEKQSGV